MQRIFYTFVLTLALHNVFAQCASYNSAYPPPYPSSYSCMNSVLNTYSVCCTGNFDATCIQYLVQQCADTGGPSACTFDQCTSTGCTHRPMPYCGSSQQICPTYSSSQPPPGPNPPNGLDGILLELFYFDGYCCQNGFDQLCWNILDSLALKACNDGIATTIDGVTSELGCTHTPATASSPYTLAKLKVYLQGPYDATLDAMTTHLRTKNLLPNAQPFNRIPWSYSGSENVASLPANMVDWVLVEARSALDKNIVLSRRAALLLSDGTVQSTDGTNGVKFTGISPNTNYFIVVRSRNHLPIMSAVPLFLPTYTTYDFTEEVTQARNTAQQQMVEVDVDPVLFELYGMRAGDMNGDGQINTSDFNAKYMPARSAVNKYADADVNMDGMVTVEDFNFYRSNQSIVAPSYLTY